MDNFEQFYNRTLRFLSYRPRSEKEIKDYLELKTKNLKLKTKGEMINSIIDRLKEHKFINDNDFAKWWIDQRTRVKPRAWKIIQYELKQKGIDEEIIKSQISNSPTSPRLRGAGKFQIPSDLESAKILVQKKSFRYRDLPKQEAYQKLARFLASKGFDWGVIKKALSNIDD